MKLVQDLKHLHLSAKNDMDYFNKTGGMVKGSYERLDIQANPSSYIGGGETIFKDLRKGDCQFINNIELVVTTSPITSTGGTYKRFVSNFIEVLFKRMEMYNKEELLAYVDNKHAINTMNTLTNDFEAYDNVVVNKIGQLSSSARNTAASGVQTFRLNLKSIFDCILDRPFPVFLLNDETSLRFKFRLIDNLSSLVELDGSAPVFSITDMHLEVEYVKNETIANYYRSIKGFSPMLTFHQLQQAKTEIDLASGSTLYTKKIDELQNKDVCFISFSMSTSASDIDGTLPAYVKIDKFALTSSGKYLTPKQVKITDESYKNFDIYNLDVLNKKNLYGKNLYIINYSDSLVHELSPQLVGINYNDWLKSKTHSRFFSESDTQLELEFASSLGSNHKVTVNTWYHQHFIINQAGNLTKL